MTNLIDTFVASCHEQKKNVLYAQRRTNGHVVDEYQAFPQKTRLNLMSVSKSFVSAGVGIAQLEGLLDLDEKICEAFPENVPEDANDFLLNTTLTHMLTMTTGLAEPLFFADSPERYQVKDWIDHFFRARFDHPSGARFLYSNFNTYMLSALIEKRAGVNLLEYLRDRLFEPIGLGNPDWTLCPKGHCYAANGLYLNIDELGLFGELLLHGGEWNGKSILPAEYLAKATVKQVETRAKGRDEMTSYGYGYQFWMTPIPDTYICNGNYGQYCLVMPKKDTVISVLSLEGNSYQEIRRILLELAAQL